MSQHSATPRKSRKALVVAFLAVAAIVAGLVIVFTVSKGSTHSALKGEDTGIAACKEIKRNADKPSKNDNSPVTKDELKKLRAPFEQSKHSDIKAAGVAFANTVYNVSNQDTDDFGSALAAIGAIQAKYTALQTACGAHGVEIPDLDLSDDGSSEPAPAETI